MITCANCSGNFGAAHNFGFLVQSEIIGADSYHFTLQKSLIGGFEKNYVQIDKFLLEDKYYLVKCVSCGVEVGRKLVVPKDFSYIVFEKEKLLYDSVQVGKDVIWGRLLSQPPFNEFQMFKIEEFKDVKLKTLTKKLPTGKMSGPHAVNQSCVAKQRDSKFGRRNDHTPDNSTKAVRPRVGDSVDEKVKFLKSKRETWDANQLIYEFTTASSASWKDIMSRGFEDDDNGRILHEVFDLLSLQEIRENPNAAALYTPFSQQNGPHAVSTYLMVGDLKESSIEEAVSKGRGGKVWVEVMCSALCAAQTLRYVMDKFVAVRSNTMMSMIMEVFSLRVSALIGEQFAETDTLNGWAPSLSDEDKNKCHSTAKILASIVEAIKRMQKASNDARIQKSDKNATEDAEREKEVARTRHSRGVSFMDDPSRDKDYLIATDMPTPANLLSPPPTSLPENHIESGSSTDSGQFDSDQLSVTPQRPYRDLNHYLNTHFILVLEDCVAQLRRGIKAYREILNGIEFSKLDTHHVERSCVSFVRSRDSGAYMYGDVIIENVEAMRNGIGYVVSFKMFEARKVDWQNSSRFMNGSLLCLSRDGSFSEESMILATVMKGVQTPKGKCHESLLGRFTDTP